MPKILKPKKRKLSPIEFNQLAAELTGYNEMTASPDGLSLALQDYLKDYVLLRDAAETYKQMSDSLKPLFYRQEVMMIGRFKVSGSMVSQPAKSIKAFSYWNWRVKLL